MRLHPHERHAAAGPASRRPAERAGRGAGASMTARLECAGLTGGWGDLTAFRDVDLAVQAGQMHAVLGPNGAGQTTLLLTLAGLLPWHDGAVSVEGSPLRPGRATAAS